MFTEYYSVIHTQMEWLMADVYLTKLASFMLLLIKVSFMMPAFLFALIYFNMLLIGFFGFILGLKDPSPENKSWKIIRHVSARFWNLLGRFWHGHEIEGLDNVPSQGAALMVYYHGTTAIESYNLMADVYLLRHRVMSFCFDKAVCLIPGCATGLKLFRGGPACFETCVRILNEGHLMVIAPGGIYECQFSDHNYRLQWRNRLGYAKVAIEAKVPIIPFFTVNNREAYRAVNIANSFFEKLYLKLRVPIKPVYGGFPVKLRTVFGEPIPYDPTLTAEQLDLKVRMALEQLIKDNQRIPGSIAMALLDRVYCPKKIKPT